MSDSHQVSQGEVAPPSTQIVTAAQRLELIRERATYEPHPQLTPDNAMSGEVHGALERLRESQIDHMGERLYDAHDRLQSHRDKAIHKGRAAAGFNRAAESQDFGRQR